MAFLILQALIFSSLEQICAKRCCWWCGNRFAGSLMHKADCRRRENRAPEISTDSVPPLADCMADFHVYELSIDSR